MTFPASARTSKARREVNLKAASTKEAAQQGRTLFVSYKIQTSEREEALGKVLFPLFL